MFYYGIQCGLIVHIVVHCGKRDARKVAGLQGAFGKCDRKVCFPFEGKGS